MNAANVDSRMSAEDFGICIAIKTQTFPFLIFEKPISDCKITNV